MGGKRQSGRDQGQGGEGFREIYLGITDEPATSTRLPRPPSAATAHRADPCTAASARRLEALPPGDAAAMFSSGQMRCRIPR